MHIALIFVILAAATVAAQPPGLKGAPNSMSGLIFGCVITLAPQKPPRGHSSTSTHMNNVTIESGWCQFLHEPLTPEGIIEGLCKTMTDRQFFQVMITEYNSPGQTNHCNKYVKKPDPLRGDQYDVYNTVAPNAKFTGRARRAAVVVADASTVSTATTDGSTTSDDRPVYHSTSVKA
jgi:hypothetical protein